jgi:hypothetical protein
MLLSSFFASFSFIFSYLSHDKISQRPDGITFKVEITDFKFDKLNKPKPGDVVTFTYENYSRRAAPVKPKLQRIRGDISWEEV